MCAAVGSDLLDSPKRLKRDAAATPALWRLRDGLGARHSKLTRRAYPDPTAYAVAVVADDLGSIKALNDIPFVHGRLPFVHGAWIVGLRIRRWQPVLAARGKREHALRCRHACEPDAAHPGANAAVVLLDVGAVPERRLPAQRADGAGALDHPMGARSVQRRAAALGTVGSRCGRKGATLQHPSWAGHAIGFRPFPTTS